MPRLLVVILLVVNAQLGCAPLARQPKRRRSTPISAALSAVELLTKAAEMLTLRTPAHVYLMDSIGDKERLIQYLWKGNYASAIGRWSCINPSLISLFMEQAVDELPARPDNMQRVPNRFESVVMSLFRSRSANCVPFEVAALSVLLLHFKVPREAWETIACLSHSVMSRKWTEELCDLALTMDPGAQYRIATGISAAVFDNFMIKVGFGSYSMGGQTGTRFWMTNWASASIPASAVPAGFDIRTYLADGGIFRSDMVLSDFLDLFSPVAPDILANQRSRWREMLSNAAAEMLWDREPFESPYPPTHFHYHDPIMGRLQSSYEDVNFELDVMRTSTHHIYSDCVMIGGDGLSYMRLIHRLAQNPRAFLETTPVVIPRFGESPHGLFHLMHGDWRIWEPLLMKMAVVTLNKQVKCDPTVEDFNSHRHFLQIVTTAFAEYVVEIAATGSTYNDPARFLAAAERNLSFGYICYFLYLFGFKYLQMRNAIRKNDSGKLDQIWRENLRSARTSKGNKTNYSKMSVILIYWGVALKRDISVAFHNTRTLRWIHSHTGWDMFIEGLNLLIKKAVTSNITEEQIKKFIRRVNFTHIVKRGIHSFMNRNVIEKENKRLMRIDIDKIKAELRLKIGSDYETCTTPSDENSLDIDMTDWGGDRNAASKRHNTPWEQMHRTMLDYRQYVTEKVGDLCPWHHWL